MKGTFFKVVALAVIVMSLVVPVSARTAGQPGAPGIGDRPGAPAESPLVDWYENWDSYPTGQNMHGEGGWKGWFNDPNATAFTSAAQSISAPNSVDIHGASDLVHEYAVDDGVWTYTAWQFVPTDFAGTTYFILLNQYDDQGLNLNWSLEVSFDSPSGLVANDGPAGGTLPLIKGQWVELRAEIDLVADWQKFYYGGDLLFEDSWSNGMSGGGITSIGAVDLFANAASPVYYDDLSLVEVVGNWYEDWDSYPTGQNMHGVGGWKGWFNDPNATAFTSAAQSISAPNSVDIHGASDLVHEYTVDDGVWTYTAWQFVPTDFAGTNYFILLNQYDDQGLNLNWSLEVSFDSPSGLVANDGPAGGTLPLIKGQWVELRAEIDLVADWQKFYYGGDLLFEDSWSNGMSGGGITSIGAVDLFANAASPVYYDDLSLVEGIENTMFAKVRLSGKALGGLYVVTAIVRVRDAAGNMIEGADVTAFLKKPNGTTKMDTRTTNATGRAAFPMASPTGGYWLACIEDVQHPDYAWDDSGPKCDFLEFPAP